MKAILILAIKAKDYSYLAEFLLKKECKLNGIKNFIFF